LANPTQDTPTATDEIEPKSDSEVEFFTEGDTPEPETVRSEDTLEPETLTGEDNLTVPATQDAETGEQPEYDFLTTLEMPVFRMPGATRTSTAQTTESGANIKVPLSGLLRQRRAAEEEAVKNGTLNAQDLLPHVVVHQPRPVSLTWNEGAVGAPKGRKTRKKRTTSETLDTPTGSSPTPPPVRKAGPTATPPPMPARRPGAAATTPPATPVKAQESSAPPTPPPESPAQPKAPPAAKPTAPARVETGKAEPRPQGVATAWYQEIFTEEFFRTLPVGFHKRTLREAKFIVDSLEVGDGGRILDLCCGFGRHTMDLAKRNYDMVGLDLSLPLLQKALGEAQRRSLSVRFIHGDARDLNFEGIFDAAYSWQTSFGYFDDKTNFDSLCGVNRALKAGGRFLLEVVNREHIIRQLPRRKWWEGVDCLFLEEISFNFKSSVLHTKRSFIYDDGRPPWEQNIFIRLYSLHELHNLFLLAGFEVLETSGQIETRGHYLGPSSPHTIVLAEKKAPAS
jgi:SAM-dependent methyltransferase